MKSIVRASVIILLSFVASMSVQASINVLVARDFYDPNGRCEIDTYSLNYFLPMHKMVADDLRVFEVDSYQFDAEKDRLARYDVVVIWDLPRAMRKDGGAPEEGLRTIVSDSMQEALIDFVKQGGGLVLAGGSETVFCDSTYRERGAANATFRWGDLTYYGYKESLLDDMLTVAEERKHLWKAVEEAIQPEPLVKTAATLGRNTAIAGKNVGEGRVLSLWLGQWGPRRQGDVWDEEGVFWTEAVRWAAGQDEVTVSEAGRNELIAKHQEGTARPDEKPPVDWVEHEYPYMLWLAGFDRSEPLAYKFFDDLGFNRMSTHTADDVDRVGVPGLTNAADFGLWYYPNIDALLFNKINKILEKKTDNKDDWVGKFQDGSNADRGYGDWPSCFSPLVIETSKEMLQDTVRQYVEKSPSYALPYLKGYLLDDEQTWYLPAGGMSGRPGLVADYSSFAQDYFREKTGMDVPMPQYKAPGYVAPAGDPWLKWVEEVRMHGFIPYIKEMIEGIKEVHDVPTVGYFAGGFWGQCDVIIDEYYHQMWKEDILKTMSSADLGFARVQDLEGYKTPYWAEIFITKSPGCLGGNKGSAVDPEQLRLTAGIAFSRGLRGLIIWETPYVWEMVDPEPGAEPLAYELKRIGRFLEQYGSMLRSLRREIQPVWYLGAWLHANSFDHYRWLTPEIGKTDDGSFPWYRFQVDDIAFPSLIRAQVPAQSVTELQLMSPDVFDRQAVVLPSLQYCREEVVTNLEAYIEQGGLVFKDESMPVEVKGAITLPCRFDGWYNDVNAGNRLKGSLNDTPRDDVSNARREMHIRDLIPVIEKEVTKRIDPAVTVAHNDPEFRDGFHSTMKNGDVRYMFVFNYDLDFGRLMDVTLKYDPGFVTDVLTGERMQVEQADGAYSFKSQVEPGGWNIYMLSSEPVGECRIDRCEQNDDELYVDVSLYSANNNPMSAAVPLELTIAGTKQVAQLYRSTDEGTGSFAISKGDYLGDVKQVTVRNMITGKSISVEIIETL